MDKQIMKPCKHCGYDPRPIKTIDTLGRIAYYCNNCELLIGTSGTARPYKHDVRMQTPSIREIQREVNAATLQLKLLLTQ